MSAPKIGRIAVWVDCACGAEVVVEDVDEEGWTEQECEACGRVVEVVMSASVQETRGPR